MTASCSSTGFEDRYAASASAPSASAGTSASASGPSASAPRADAEDSYPAWATGKKGEYG